MARKLRVGKTGGIALTFLYNLLLHMQQKVVGHQTVADCLYSGTNTSAFGFIARSLSPKAIACSSSPWTTKIFLMSPVRAST